MNSVRWTKGSFSSEAAEFKRYTQDVRELAEITNTYNVASLSVLTDTMWKALENTDSWDTKTLDDIFRALKANNAPRNLERILQQFVAGEVAAPIVISSDEGMECLAGNTRLMVARMLGVRPKVVVVKYDRTPK